MPQLIMPHDIMRGVEIIIGVEGGKEIMGFVTQASPDVVTIETRPNDDRYLSIEIRQDKINYVQRVVPVGPHDRSGLIPIQANDTGGLRVRP